MKYFFDTEFLEGKQYVRDLNGNPIKELPNTIDLISIGMVKETGEELYLVSNEFNLWDGWFRFDMIDDKEVYWIRDNVYKPIFDDIIEKNNLPTVRFSLTTFKALINMYGQSQKYIKEKILEFIGNDKDIEFYTYFGDYDWVVFCWIFGKMIELPNRFPKYAKDLAQIRDDMVRKLYPNKSLRGGISRIKSMDGYPSNNNEHLAISDAKWNLQLYNFLKKI